ncbi:MAG: hypothetical protein ACR2QK_23105 [Acidimicrobiales bacterium]
MNLTSNRLRLDDLAAVQEHFHSRGWSDGLPVVPPTATAVEACLEWAVLPPDHLVGIEPVRSRAVTAEKVAVNAVMAGCLPMHFPVVVTAVAAILAEPFELHGPTASTGGSAVLVVVNGPIRAELGMVSSFNALAGSDRATTCIGRAVRLTLINLLDVRPGGIDRSTLGHPGKISYCVAEDEETSPWPSLAAERLGLADPRRPPTVSTAAPTSDGAADPSTPAPGSGSTPAPMAASAVTVFAAMAPRQIMNEWTTEPEEILDTFVAEIKANMRHYSIWAGNYGVVIAPQLRAHLAAAGWSKHDVQTYVFERARVKRSEWSEVGKGSVVMGKGDREYAALTSPDDLLVIAGGGPAGGFGAVVPPWLGTKSRAVTLPIGACVNC